MAKADVYNRLDSSRIIEIPKDKVVRLIKPNLYSGAVWLLDLTTEKINEDITALLAWGPNSLQSEDEARVLSMEGAGQNPKPSRLGGNSLQGKDIFIDHQLVPSRFLQFTQCREGMVISNISGHCVFYRSNPKFDLSDVRRSTFNDRAICVGKDLPIVSPATYAFAQGIPTLRTVKAQLAESAQADRPRSTSSTPANNTGVWQRLAAFFNS